MGISDIAFFRLLGDSVLGAAAVVVEIEDGDDDDGCCGEDAVCAATAAVAPLLLLRPEAEDAEDDDTSLVFLDRLAVSLLAVVGAAAVAPLPSLSLLPRRDRRPVPEATVGLPFVTSPLALDERRPNSVSSAGSVVRSWRLTGEGSRVDADCAVADDATLASDRWSPFLSSWCPDCRAVVLFAAADAAAAPGDGAG